MTKRKFGCRKKKDCLKRVLQMSTPGHVYHASKQICRCSKKGEKMRHFRLTRGGVTESERTSSCNLQTPVHEGEKRKKKVGGEARR